MNDALLKDAIVEIRTCGEFLVKYAATLEEELKKANHPEPVAETVKVEEPALTLEMVRKVAADKSRSGFTEEVRSLIQKYGANKLSDVKAESYVPFNEGTGGIWKWQVSTQFYQPLRATGGLPVRHQLWNAPSCLMHQASLQSKARMLIRLSEYKLKKSLGEEGSQPFKNG